MSPGKVYRKDDDATHLPMFHQIEGIFIDEDVSFAHLKDLIYKICHSLFGEEAKLRFRPSYFPFTEPSAEVDVLFGDKWLEILGCGVVNPKVLENCKIDSKKYSGLVNQNISLNQFCSFLKLLGSLHHNHCLLYTSPSPRDS